jgi:hypothetical protein
VEDDTGHVRSVSDPLDLKADYVARRSLYLPEKARYDWMMQQAAVSGTDLPKLVANAMTAIEAESSHSWACYRRTTASSRKRCSKT